MPSALVINRLRSKVVEPARHRRLNVCQVVHGLPIGGAEVLVSRIVRRLDDRFRFVIACLDHIGELGESLADEGIPIVQLGPDSTGAACDNLVACLPKSGST
jgi:hypothetical protein